jgi:predicted ATP-grasp superfamily ATP-dependent carboligase
MRVGVSTARNPQVEQLSERLMTEANYRGYFNSEFKRDPRDNLLKLMEVNCRMPRGGLLPTAAGVNYPWIIYLDLVRNQQVDVTEYRIGTYWIELYADLSNSILQHREESIGPADYLRPYLARDKAFAELDLHDIRPFMALTSQRVRGAWKRVVTQ